MQEISIHISLFFELIYIIIIIFFPLNGIFDTELVHLYLSDRVQMSIKYHDDPDILSLSVDIRQSDAYHSPWGVAPPFFESYKRP